MATVLPLLCALQEKVEEPEVVRFYMRTQAQAAPLAISSLEPEQMRRTMQVARAGGGF